MVARRSPRTRLVAIVDRTDGQLQILSGGPGDEGADVLVLDGGVTLGRVVLDGTDDVPARALAAFPAPTPARPWPTGGGAGLQVSVIICTTGSNPLLVAAVTAALTQEHPAHEVIVVDNAPTTGNTRRQLAGCHDPRLTIVAEPRAGLSHARNRGVRAATGDILAFTDDDAVAHPRWLQALTDVFAADPAGAGSSIGAVTGAVYPKEIRHDSQRFFEARGGFPKTPTVAVWSVGDVPLSLRHLGDAGDGGPLYPVATARVGAGVNMAFTRRALGLMGPFDVHLGAGTATKGGEDLDAFARVLRAGLAIVYTPDAIVHHSHRTDMAGLQAQIHGNGTGMAALLTKTIVRRPVTVLQLVTRVPRVLRRLAPSSPRVAGSDDDVPDDLTRREIRGFLQGPWLYAGQVWRR